MIYKYFNVKKEKLYLPPGIPAMIIPGISLQASSNLVCVGGSIGTWDNSDISRNNSRIFYKKDVNNY